MSKKSRAATATTSHKELLELANGDLSPEALTQKAVILLTTKDLPQSILGLTPDDQEKFVDKVDQAFRPLDLNNLKYVDALGNVCSAIQRLPTSAVLSKGLEKRGNIAVASGGFTDIWRGDLGGDRVAIKAFRIYPAQNLKEAKDVLWKRVPVWMRLSHPNILQFRGVNMTLFQLSLVYDWGIHGNITQYIAANPRASRPPLLFGVAKGLKYLHSLGIPHGDLKGANVVIDRKGNARLTEFGLAPINSDPNFTVAATPGSVGTSRWLAPEIIAPGARKGGNMPVMESTAADVFAFAMISLEVFTGGRPEMPKDAQAIGLTAGMWTLLESCWQQSPKKRPQMEEVVERWGQFVGEEDTFTTFPGCAQTTLVISTSSAGPFLTSSDWSRGQEYSSEKGEGTSRRRVKTMAPQYTRTSENTRPRTMSELPGSRSRNQSESSRRRTSSVAVKSRAATIAQSSITERSQQTPWSEAQLSTVATSQQGAHSYPPAETPKAKKGSCCVIM
ncbi:kinase-like domain-containing protein [Thelephora terrestris]|uniref:Kinase-like domain-containing protein n=1 Tax=Thelephora terrestris TaxID=56493 RepID=A0A9P6HKG8_9AGAM|nr:kinase-like domain-containing protein [Thelephora terrestris]